jgi:hypothetical protein
MSNKLEHEAMRRDISELQRILENIKPTIEEIQGEFPRALCSRCAKVAEPKLLWHLQCPSCHNLVAKVKGDY